MKKLNLTLIVMLLLGAAACKKNSSTSPIISSVSVDDAATMAAGSLSANSNGIANISADVTLSATNLRLGHLTCGTTKSDTISRQSAAGASVTYNYKLNYNYVVKCDTGNHPDSLYSSLIYSGSYSGPNLSSTNTGSSIFNVAGLGSASSDFVINGEYKQTGSFSSKRDTTNHGSDNIDIVIKSLTVSRQVRSIVSGNSTIAISGTVPKKGSFNYTGTLVFNGNNKATLTLNGTVYILNLLTGEITKQ